LQTLSLPDRPSQLVTGRPPSGRAPRPRTNHPADRAVMPTRLPTAYRVLYSNNPPASDVAALAKIRIREVSVEDPRGHIVSGLLRVVSEYLTRADKELLSRVAILTFREVIGAVARHELPVHNFLSRIRKMIGDELAFRAAVEEVTGVVDKHEKDDYLVARTALLSVFTEPQSVPEAK
jgi:hypothetical protein